MTWSTICAVLPVVISNPERASNAARIETELARQCPGVNVLLAPQWWEEQPPRSEPFERIASALVSVPGEVCLYLEDDATLGPDFATNLERVIDDKLDGRTAVSLFHTTQQPDGYHPAPRPFCYAQCLLMPSWLAHEWGRYLPEWERLERTQQYYFAPDICFGEVCDAHGVELLIHYPSLVQHLPIASACGHTHYPSSPTFRG